LNSMLLAFFDDSGTHGDSAVMAMGGLLGTVRQWEFFAPKWQGLLDSPVPGKPRLAQFHLYPCRRGQGDFIDYSLAERDFLTNQFREVILGSGLVTLATAVDMKSWKELVVGDVAEQQGDPLEFCFFKCIEMVTTTIRSRKPGEKVMIMFDEGTRPRVELFARFVLYQKEKYPEIADVGFGVVKDITPLQGADMIAYETFLYGLQWLENGGWADANPHFREYISRELSTGLIFQREQLEEMIGRVREVMARRPDCVLPGEVV
jgi:hypothetical protein